MANAAAGLADATGKPREIMERTKLLAQVQVASGRGGAVRSTRQTL